jgi:ubiquitin carboxyl-terminal hydrolase 25/28
MDRFLATANPEKRELSIQLTRTMTDTRTRLHSLRDRKPLSIPGAFKHVREALGQIQDLPELAITPDFLNALESEEHRITAEIERLSASLVETKARLAEVWREEKGMEYELVAVFMHRGKSDDAQICPVQLTRPGKTSGAGHYWTYQAHLPDHGECLRDSS